MEKNPFSPKKEQPAPEDPETKTQRIRAEIERGFEKQFEKDAPGSKERLETVVKKGATGQELNTEDLSFLYATKVAGRWWRDPRIEEIRSQRDPKEDAPRVLGCRAEEIAWKKEEITEQTKVYIGPLFPGIFETLSHLKALYTSFPEGKITRLTGELGGQTKKELKTALENGGFAISGNARVMMRSKDLTTEKKTEQIHLVRLKASDLGIDDHDTTTGEFYRRAEEFGLEICPAEVGPHLRLRYSEQPNGEQFVVAMRPIMAADFPSIFLLGRTSKGMHLSRLPVGAVKERLLEGRLHKDWEFVFRLRPSTNGPKG